MTPRVTPSDTPFAHECCVCGDYAFWGFGAFKDKQPQWFCYLHRPDPPESKGPNDE
jgi:hypothetical protein